MALVLVPLAIGGCRSSRIATCETISVACDTSALRPSCATITPADSSVYLPAPRALVGLVPRAEVERLLNEDLFYRAAFESRALPSDSVWVYEGGFVVGGLRMGDDGLVALRGCTSVALYPMIMYN